MRDQVLSSGFPLIFAGACLIVLVYLASIRRERFLLYWTGAWAVLLMRYAWNIIWGSPFTILWTAHASGYMRLAFAGCILAGVEELRGRRVAALVVFSAAAALLVVIVAISPLLPPGSSSYTYGGVMALMMVAASVRLGTFERLPRLERRATAAALASYGMLSFATPNIPENGPLFLPMLEISWAAQLFICIGMLAVFFRSSYDAELRFERQQGQSLTAALQNFVPICMHCKSIRDEKQRWHGLEQYVSSRSSTVFSHGVCPTCAERHYGEIMVM